MHKAALIVLVLLAAVSAFYAVFKSCEPVIGTELAGVIGGFALAIVVSLMNFAARNYGS